MTGYAAMVRTFKQRLQAGEILRIFALARAIHPLIIELFGRAGGYDGFWVDQEHASVSTEQMLVASVAARANNFDMFVRIPPSGYWQVTQCLEAGASGVMCAQIHSVEQAKQFVSWCRFAPEGVRGLNNNGCDADYTFKPQPQFVSDANRDVLIGIQLETLGALENVTKIAELSGVDLLFVGPSDLSLALGVVGQFHHERLWEAITAVSRACQQTGKSWGCVAPDARFAERARALGCRMLTVGNDVLALRRGIEALKSTFAETFA